MKHFVLWGMDVENTWRTHPWISNSLLGMRCMTLPKKLPRWWFFPFHMFWQLFASDSDMFNVFDGPFRGNRWFVSFPHQKIVSTKSGYRANAHLLHDFDTIADHGTSILVHAALHVPNQQISEANLTKATKTQKKHHTRFNQAKYTLLALHLLLLLNWLLYFLAPLVVVDEEATWCEVSEISMVLHLPQRGNLWTRVPSATLC